MLQEFTLSGTIAPDGTWVGGIAWEAVASAAQLGALIGFEADQICELADAADQPCEACPGGGGAASCVRVAADRMTAEAVDTALAVVDEEACDAR